VTHCAYAPTVNIPIARHTRIRRMSLLKEQCSAFLIGIATRR
jgi:hypothetical protein